MIKNDVQSLIISENLTLDVLESLMKLLFNIFTKTFNIIALLKNTDIENIHIHTFKCIDIYFHNSLHPKNIHQIGIKK